MIEPQPLNRDDQAARAYHEGMERARRRRAIIQGRLMELTHAQVPLDGDEAQAFHREFDAKGVA